MIHNHEVPSSILGPATLPRLITQCVVSFFYVIIIYRMLLGLISCNQIAHQYFFNIACAEHYLCTCYTLLYSSVLWLVYIPFLIHQHNDVMSFSVCRPYYHAPYIIIYVHYIIYIAFYF